MGVYKLLLVDNSFNNYSIAYFKKYFKATETIIIVDLIMLLDLSLMFYQKKASKKMRLYTTGNIKNS
jgi:hypothetical protein